MPHAGPAGGMYDSDWAVTVFLPTEGTRAAAAAASFAEALEEVQRPLGRLNWVLAAPPLAAGGEPVLVSCGAGSLPELAAAGSPLADDAVQFGLVC